MLSEAYAVALAKILRDFPGNGRYRACPKFRRHAEVAPEAHGSVGRDRATSEHNVIGPRARHLDRIGELVDADSHRGQELVAQDFAGMGRWMTAPGRYIREVN